MPQDGFSLEESIGFLLTQAARAFARDLKARLQTYGITPAQFCVLTCLWEVDGLSASALGERAGLDQPTITGVVDRLERQGLVYRRRSTDDRRFVTVHLAPTGDALREAVPTIALASNERALRGLAPEDVAHLRRMLYLLLANLSGER